MADNRINYYKGIDGREYATMDQVRAADKAYIDNLYTFKVNDKNMRYDVFKARQEERLSYLRERYGDSLDKLLEEYGYGSQEVSKGPRR